MTTNPKIPRQSFKSTNVESWGCSDIFQEKNHSGGMHFKEFIGKKGNCKEGVWGVNCRNLIWYSFLAERFDWRVQDWYWVSGLVLDYLLHLVPARKTRAGSGVLRSRCLSALQELVGRNGLPLLLSTSFKNMLCYLLISILKLYLCVTKWCMFRLWCKLRG